MKKHRKHAMSPLTATDRHRFRNQLFQKPASYPDRPMRRNASRKRLIRCP